MMYDFKNKAFNVEIATKYMLTKTLHMFEYENLPETIPHRELEKQLQEHGYSFITEVNGSLYAFTGGLGGVLDVYGNPTQINITNPALSLTETRPLTDGVLVINDDYLLGVRPLIDKYNTFAVENDINMLLHGYASRMTRLISASDDKTKESAQRYIDQLIAGEVTVVAESPVFDGVRTQDLPATTGSITQLIEYANYIRSTLMQELGMGANNNMKRERLVSAEVDVNDGSLFPLVYNMMANRLEGIEAVNAKYNTDIQVDFGSVWADKHRELVDDIVGDAESLEPEQPNQPEQTNQPEETPDESSMEDSTESSSSSDDGTSNPPRTEAQSGGAGESREATPVTETDGSERSEGSHEEIDNLEATIKQITDELADPDIDPEVAAELQTVLDSTRAQLAEILESTK